MAMDSTIVLSTANGQSDIWRWTDRSLNELWHTESNTVIGNAFMTWISARTSSVSALSTRFPHRPHSTFDPYDAPSVIGLHALEDLYPPPVADFIDFDNEGMFYVETDVDHPGDFVVVTPHRQPVRIRDIPSKLIRRAFISDFTIRKGYARPCFEQIEHSTNGEKRSYMRILLPICNSICQVTRVYAICRSLVGGSNNLDVVALKASAVD
jgi:hypothetical protein